MEMLSPPARRAGGGSEGEFRPEERYWFTRGIRELARRQIPCLVAGGFGFYYYSGFWRNTKDLDLVILPEHRDAAVEAICSVGLTDLYDREPYDREWIFRGAADGVILDLIWQFANKADQIDRSWFGRAVPATFLGLPARYVSAADLIWMKLLVFQAKRCDWPDLLNIIRGTRGELDWDHLLRVVGEHWRLMAALTEIYDWLCPEERGFIPESFRSALDARRQAPDPVPPERAEHRHVLFDSRPWLTEAGAGHRGTRAESEPRRAPSRSRRSASCAARPLA